MTSKSVLWLYRSYVFDKRITAKRKVAWYRDPEYLYTYSITIKQALAWTKELELKQIAEAAIKFNSSLQKLYQNGNESIGWPRWKITREEQYYSFIELWRWMKSSFRHANWTNNITCTSTWQFAYNDRRYTKQFVR